MWNNFIATVGPPFIGLLALVATAAITLGVSYVKQNWMQGVAQSAFANAAGGIVNKLGEELLTTILTPGHIDVIQAVEKVQARIPDKIKALGLTPAGIAERIIDNVGKLQAPAIGALLPRLVVPTPATAAAPGGTGFGGAVPASFDRPRTG